MTFYLIASQRPEDTSKRSLLQKACERRGVTVEALDVETSDPLHLPTLTESDILYRASTVKKARMIEKLLLNETCAHIYQDLFTALSSHGGSFFHHIHRGLPVIPTIPFIPGSRENVSAAVEKLGGFPLIVKAIGGSLGVGVIKVDSLESLNSLLDYFRNRDIRVYLRAFIEHEYYIRAVVLGGDVIASHTTYPVVGEFRTNVEGLGEQRREATHLPPEISRIAALAAKAIRIDFAGVDILIDKEGAPYIAEVNAPFDFVCTQKITGVDIAGKFVDYLVEKSQQASA